MEQLDETGHRLPHRLLIAASEVLPKAEVALGEVAIASLAHLPEDLSEVVGDESEVVRVRRVRGLLELPARDVRVEAVVERGVHLLRHRMEEVRRADDG